MYKVMVHAGMQEGASVVKPGTDEIQLFETRESASNFAMKLRNGSSLGVWCRPFPKQITQPIILHCVFLDENVVC